MKRWFILVLLATASLLLLSAHGNMYGSQSITPHDYQSLGEALALSAPSCGYPYVTLDISRITAVQLMSVGSECGTCLRVETSLSNYIEDGATVGLPGVAMATHFEATTTAFPQLPTTSVAQYSAASVNRRALARRSDSGDEVRYIYVLAVDTGGRGLDMAQVSFTALFGQSLSPMPAVWFPVDSKYCSDIWRNSTKKQLKSPTSMRDIPVNTGPSEAPPGLDPVSTSGTNKDSNNLATSAANTMRLSIAFGAIACALLLLLLI
ncbi:hypothetical protein GGI25_001719 [Coemansia spiralis]|uniref:Expansin-like EG45 domain-containing protein n=2 Tax=Coemansia TaxID=4863 RepID=A0A9W8GBJ3_9FUNG|nr:hypothetical protein BX070DRAFT_99658 [Coemansia spiralis]KAJ1991401.1 hypothetical protein EDC05_003471 [Coemansia umbellata]KAJ2624941.1 hypothetical protein GGI26_001053 [Coemansia sp. RSA 1358]KAJ2679151.1 hypothetical protein GGI25_001719 [Coemansia spiralis]